MKESEFANLLVAFIMFTLLCPAIKTFFNFKISVFFFTFNFFVCLL